MFEKKWVVIIVSVLVAIILWMSINPTRTVKLKVDLKIKNSKTLKSKNLQISKKNLPNEMTVTVVGRENVVKNVQPEDIDLYINAKDIKKAGSNEVTLHGPTYTGKENGIYVRNNTEDKITVIAKDISTTKEGKISKEFIIDLSDDVNFIGRKSKYTYTANSQNNSTETYVWLKGPTDVINKLTVKDISPYINVSNLKMGTVKMELNFNLPEGVTVDEQGTFKLIIDKEE